jgi:hypothetical protein
LRGELETALKEFKKDNMASGTDSMVNEFLKYGGYEEDCENRF